MQPERQFAQEQHSAPTTVGMRGDDEARQASTAGQEQEQSSTADGLSQPTPTAATPDADGEDMSMLKRTRIVRKKLKEIARLEEIRASGKCKLNEDELTKLS
jgi:hypothetical protein